MQIPVTEAFDDDDDLESVTIEIHPSQLDWLRSQAKELDLSLDHVLRSVINAQMRASEPAKTEEDTDNVVNNLRAASKRLEALMGDREKQKEKTNKTLSRLQERLNEASTSSASSPSKKTASSESAPTDASASSPPSGSSSASQTSKEGSTSDGSLSDTELLNRAREALQTAAGPSKKKASDDDDDDGSDTQSMFDMMG